MKQPLKPIWRILVLAAVISSATAASAQAQELFCGVSVSYSQLSGSDYSYLSDLEIFIEEYFNQRTWTEDRFRDEERIDCNFNITFLEAVTLTSFRARIVVNSTRPIYGTAQARNVVRISDEDWRFDYAQGTPLIHDVDRFDAMTSLLDFYAYIILGYDYDTFSELGGTEHFDKARLIAELAQSTGGAGWSELGGDRSRGELIRQILDPRMQALRRAYFRYFFDGLDHFVAQPDAARAEILAMLEELQALREEVARSYALDLFFSTLSTDLKSIFMESTLAGQAYDILTQVDPSNLTTYNELLN